MVRYAVQDGIDWPMAIFVAVPQMVGVVVGWKIARAVPARSLAFALAFMLIGLAPCLALGAGDPETFLTSRLQRASGEH